MNSKNNYIKKLSLSDLNSLSNLLEDSFIENFKSIYLFDLKSFKAYGSFKDDKLTSIVSYYVSNNEPSWYLTNVIFNDDDEMVSENLSFCIKENESNNIYKFYSLVKVTNKYLDRDIWIKTDDERYGFYDEYLIPAKTKSFFNNHWEILQKRILLPDDYIVRCNFLKPEYRELKSGASI